MASEGDSRRGRAADDFARLDDSERLPKIDFATFVLSLSHNVLVHLGDAPNPGEADAARDLPMARQTIDVLGLLEEKTRGNLSGEEERLLSQTLYDLRMRYIEVSKTR